MHHGTSWLCSRRIVALGLMLLCACSLNARAEPVRVGIYDNPPKLTLVGDRPSGILGDLLQAIATREGWELEPVVCDWEECLRMLRRGDIDMMPDVALSPERERLFSFHTQPSLSTWSQLYSEHSETLHSPVDLKDKRIAVLAGSIQLDYLRTLTEGFGVQVRFIEVPNLEGAFSAVEAGKADVAVANQLVGDFNAHRFGLVPTPMVFQPVGLFYATPKGQGAELRRAIDGWLSLWQSEADSPYYDVLRRWSLQETDEDVPRELIWSLIGLIAALLVAIAFVVLLKRRIAEKTRYLKESEARLHTILANVDAYIFIKGRDYKYQYVNHKLCELFGCSEADIIGKGDEELFTPETVAQQRATDRLVLENGERVMNDEISVRLESSQTRICLVVKQPLRNERGEITGLVGVSTDVTERKRSEEQIHKLAYYDSLTGLPNQRMLLDRLEHTMARVSRTGALAAVLFIDLDNFRDLNDILGHKAGDRLLEQVAERLLLRVRQEDTLARFGGDEFVLVVEDLDPQPNEARVQVERLAGDLHKLINVAFDYDDHTFTPTASIGVAMFADSGNGAGELIKCAELAMYEAKGSGRNSISFYEPSMQVQVRSRAQFEAGIRRGLERNEFALHYQPQYDIDGRLLGVESLVRWRHPQRGMVPPGDFIPVAETSGLIRPLGRWILKEACEQLVCWAQEPVFKDICIAVNISAYQMHEAGFVEEVLAILDDTGADAAHLKLELTESVLVRNIEQTIDTMARLRERGVQFSLDDFGTGYSSLTYLKRLPLNQLKIDQSFVRDLLTDMNDAAIVRTVIALGESLDLAVIAEGVETVEQRDVLLEYGCRHFQGYLFSKPLPVEELEALLVSLEH